MHTSVLNGFLLLALLARPLELVSAAPQAPDGALSERVARTVHGYAGLSIFDDVNVEIVDRVATLTGRVTTAEKKEELGRRARVEGVTSVINAIGVLPSSPQDQQLRERAASAIYNHPAFWRYAELVNPSVHIIVENGRITLAGEVDAPVERMLASSLAQGAGASSVTNTLRVGRH